jgi:hypothetical protein
MSYRLQQNATRVRWHTVARLGAAVLCLAFLAGVYLRAWTSWPFYVTFGGSAVLLGVWVVRRNRRALRRARGLRFEVDGAQLTVEQDGQKWTVVTKETVRRITHDAHGIVAIYGDLSEPVFRMSLADLEGGQSFWQQLKAWGPIDEVPTGRFSPPESLGQLVAVVICIGLIMYVSEPAFVITFGLITAVVLVASMRVPWRHRRAPAAQRVLWAGALLGGIVAVRMLLIALGG